MDTELTQDELPFYQFSTPAISKSFNQIIFERESQELLKKLAGMEDYPEPWHRQTPKGYEPHIDNKNVINNGLALKVFEEKVCDHCSCKTTVVNDLLESQTSFEE